METHNVNNKQKSVSKSHGNKPEIKCKVCGKCFTWKSVLKLHMLLHTVEAAPKCSICGDRFKQNCSLKRHMIECHEMRILDLSDDHNLQDETPHLKCELCHRKYTCKSNLDMHMRTHTGERPFVCEICGKRFAQKNSFNLHQHIHNDRIPYACNICGQQFKWKHSMNKHINHVHNKIPQASYECAICAKSYVNKSSLDRHKVILFFIRVNLLYSWYII